MALDGGHRRHAEQRLSCRGPGYDFGRIDPGLGDVHAVGRQSIQLQQPAPGPRAGSDHGGGGREDSAFPRPGIAGAVVPRAVAQRHVYQHDHAQPVGLWHQHLGGRRCDQPVEKHHGLIGKLPKDAIECG